MNDEIKTGAIEQYEGSGITPYGRRAEIRELVERLRLMAPGGVNLTQNEALALAQYSYSMGLNPLVGECWFIKDKDGKPLGMVPGIKGYRRKAQEQATSKGSDYWLEFDEITNPDERAKFFIPEGALAAKVKLYELHKTQAYAASAKAMAESGAPWEDIKRIIGDKPYVEGISFIKKDEMARLERGKLQMPHIQRARKRAEAHALKQAYHLPFGDQAPAEDAPLLMDEYIIEGSFTQIEAGEEPVEDSAEEEATEETAVEEAAQESEYEWPDEWIDWIRSPSVNAVPPDAHPAHVVALMKLSPFVLSEDKSHLLYGQRKVTKTQVKVWLKEYRVLRDGDADSKTAASGATGSWEAKYGTAKDSGTDAGPTE